MATIPSDVQTFLAEHRDSREYRRALAVKYIFLGYDYATISTLLDMAPSSISAYWTAYQAVGVAGFRLQYKGARPFLTADQRAAVIAWLQADSTWSLERLRTHLQTTYHVTFQSDQSYYALFAAANITYKRTQATNPERNDAQVLAKKKNSKPS